MWLLTVVQWGLQDLGQVTLYTHLTLLHHTRTAIHIQYHASIQQTPSRYIVQALEDMSGDILHNKPARPSTVIPGHWLINLPPDTPIYIQRYRSTETTSDSREQALLEDILEVQWRKINSTGNGGIKDILAGGCATIVESVGATESERERELWIFNTDGAKLEELQSIERESIDLCNTDNRCPTRPPSNHTSRITRMLKTRFQYLLPFSTVHFSTT